MTRLSTHNMPTRPASPMRACASGPAGRAPSSRYLFLAVCFYFAAQAYMIPVACIGAAYAIWPTLADFAVLAMLAAIAFGSRSPSATSRPHHSLLGGLWLLGFVCIAWFLGLTVFSTAIGLQEILNESSQSIGLFHLYRLIQFVIVYRSVSLVDLSAERLRILRRLVTVSLSIVCGSTLLSYLGIIESATYVACVTAESAGNNPWAEYVLSSPKGWGTVSYSHAYTAAQILLLLSLRIHLSERIEPLAEALAISIGMLAIFASGSRSGMAAGTVFVLGLLTSRPAYAIVVACMIAVAVLFLPGILPGEWLVNVESTWERQSRIMSAYDEESTNGRHEIWKSCIDHLNDSPVYWLTGMGVGMARNAGTNAHNLYLHIILEMGLVGLLAWLFFFLNILILLRRHEPFPHPLFMVTIALLFSALSQETFYPVPAMGHFLGFYLCSVAVALRRPRVPDSAAARTACVPHYHFAGVR